MAKVYFSPDIKAINRPLDKPHIDHCLLYVYSVGEKELQPLSDVKVKFSELPQTNKYGLGLVYYKQDIPKKPIDKIPGLSPLEAKALFDEIRSVEAFLKIKEKFGSKIK